MKHLFASLCACLLLTITAYAQTDNTPPLRRVTLYKHGVGYFERQGNVDGEAQVTLLFNAEQLNDVLKSLVVLDLNGKQNGGRPVKISSVTFDSIKPVEKRLAEFGISLDNGNQVGLTSLLGQLKGARVQVQSNVAAAQPITGTIIGIEKRTRTLNGERSEVQELILVSAGGELRSLELDQLRGIKLLDARLRQDLDDYLAVLQSTIHKNARKLTIATTGAGQHDLFVSYIVEAPVWKTTYRVVLDAKSKPLLQGWAVVDNAQDEDWTDVTLSLVSGAPVSFIQDLQQPIYKQRPVVGMPDDVSVMPTIPQASLSLPAFKGELSAGGGGSSSLTLNGASTLAGAVKDANGAAVAGARVTVMQAGTGAQTVVSTDSEGRYAVRGLPAGRYNARVDLPGFKSAMANGLLLAGARTARYDFSLEVGSVTETVSVVGSATNNLMGLGGLGRAMKDEAGGVVADVATQEIGELFQYRIAQPVSIKRNSSALIPIVQSEIEGEAVSLYNRATREGNPMSALYLHNTTGLTLEAGSMTILENDTYAGEALAGRIKPNERRFITYAVDLGCRVSIEEDEQKQRAFLAEIVGGNLRVHYKQAKTTVYQLSNVGDRAKTVYIEHPRDKESGDDETKWQLVKTPKPVETTEEFYRFKVTVPPGASTKFTVTQELPDVTTYALSNLTSNQIELFIKERYLSPQMKSALDGIMETKGEVAALARQIDERRAEINTIAQDQTRMRENLRALGKTDEEKQLVQRYVAKIAQGEDQLEKLRAEEKRLSEQRSALQSQMEERLRKLALEYRMN